MGLDGNERNVQSSVLSLRVQAEGGEPDTTKYPDQEVEKELKGKMQGVTSYETWKDITCWQHGVQTPVHLNCSHPKKNSVRPVENYIDL